MHRTRASIARRARAAATAAALSIPCLTAAAQPARLDPVVVTGARGEQPLDEALAPVTLITREDLERLQAADLVELIGRQAGVQFARSGGPGTVASLFARGAASSQLLVLVDGVRVNGATTGGAVLGGIALDAIERIEIVRGNLSSLYGSEAIGGVVQIFTRGAAVERALHASIEGGSGGTAGGALNATAGFGDTRLSATVAARQTEPFSAIDAAGVAVAPPFVLGANPDRDGNRQRAGALRIWHRASAATTFGVSARSQRNRTDFDSPADGPTATHEEDARSELWQANVRHVLSEVWTLSALVGQAADESDSRANVPASWSAGRVESRNRSAQIEAQARLAEQVAARLGLEYLEQRGAATAYDPTFGGALTGFRRHVGSGWFGVTGRTADGEQSVQINLRQDDYSDAGRRATWLVAYGHALAPGLRATAQASTAFRAPSFNDLHWPSFGNPRLRPERADSVELGLRYAQPGARAALALFRTRTRDLIQFAGMRVENVARARAEGIELSAALQRGPWRLDANATYLDARDEASGLPLLRRAPWTANAGLFHERGRVSVGAELGWVDARSDIDINTFARKTLPAYTQVRALARFQASPQLALKLRVENLFDERVTLVDGYQTWGRAVFGGIEWRR